LFLIVLNVLNKNLQLDILPILAMLEFFNNKDDIIILINKLF